MNNNTISSITGKLRKWTRYFFLFVFILLSVSLVRNITRMLSAEAKIHQAEERLLKLKEDNEALKKEVSEVEGDFYKEKQARDKLGLAKEGETVLVLPDEATLRLLYPKDRKDFEDSLKDPIWKRWLRLFL